MAYCLTWELAGSRARNYWMMIHAFVAEENALDERELWTLELYEEGPPSAQEERSIRARINAYLLQPRDVVYFRSGILNLLPDALRDAAAGHSMMHGLSMPSSDYGKLKSWVMHWNLGRTQVAPVRPLRLSDREEDFNRFLDLPYFTESFRQFWRVAPKMRSNRRTRVLVCIGASLSQMVQIGEPVRFDLWVDRLGAACHLTAQTKRDLRVLMGQMAGVSYDLEELAYRLCVDARAIDQQNLKRFIALYCDELSELAPELARCMQFDLE